MKISSLSRVGIALSVVFTCLLLALIAEVYYLLWWKRRIIQREVEAAYKIKPRRESCHFFCWKKQPHLSTTSSSNNTQIHHQSSDQEFQFHSQINNKDYFLTSLDENGVVGTEFVLNGPPRFLFTINEETKEDLESEDGNKSTIREGKRSLSDLLKNNVNEISIDTNVNTNTPPYITPNSSPFITPPITPIGSCHSSQSGNNNYNPFLEASNDAEFNKIFKCSPPPKFKFLRDAEEKLQRKMMLMEEEAKKEGNFQKNKEKDGSFITIIVAKNDDDNNNNGDNNHHYHSPHNNYFSGDSSSCSSSFSQVASSSTTSTSSNRKFKSFLTL